MAPCPVPFSITLTTVIGKHCKANSAQPRVAAGHTTVVSKTLFGYSLPRVSFAC